MGKYIIVAPYFPPDRTVATVRMASFVKYILKNSDEVVLVTNKKDVPLTIVDSNLCYVFVDVDTEGSGLKVFNANSQSYLSSVAEVMKKNIVDGVIVSMGPFYTYQIASLAKSNNIKCIMDFRDPWVFDYRDAKSFFKIRNILGLLAKIPKERVCVKAATLVTTVTEGWLKTFQKLYPSMKNKFKLIENGYDDALLETIKFNDKSNHDISRSKLTLGVFGKLFYYTERYSELFLRAIKKMDIDGICIKQIGTREENTDSLLEKFELPKDIIRSTGFMNYIEGICELDESDVFLIIDGRKNAIGTKIYDYIYLGKPILYIGPKKAAISSIIGKLDNGVVCSSIEEIEEAVKSFMNGIQTTRITGKDYSRTRQNERMYELLKQM